MLSLGICAVFSPKIFEKCCLSISRQKRVVETTFDFLLKSVLLFVCGKQLRHLLRSCKGFPFIVRKLGRVDYIKEIFCLLVLALDISLWLGSTEFQHKVIQLLLSSLPPTTPKEQSEDLILTLNQEFQLRQKVFFMFGVSSEIQNDGRKKFSSQLFPVQFKGKYYH